MKKIYFLPFIIAIIYIFLFAHIDTYTYDAMSTPDYGLFQRIAMNILEHKEFSGSVANDRVFCPVRPPLYPVIIALLWKITGTESLASIRIIQSIAYLLSIYFIFRIATFLSSGNKTYGFVSALCVSLIPHLAAATHVILTESIAILFLCLSILLTISLRTTKKSVYCIFLGMTLGLLTLQRPVFLLLPIPLIGYIFSFTPRRAQSLLAVVVMILLPLVVILSPWIITNKIQYGSFTTTRLAGVGHNFVFGILGNSPSLMDPVVDDMKRIIEQDIDRTPYYNEIEQILHSRSDVLKKGDLLEMKRLVSLSLLTYHEAWALAPPSAELVIMSDKFLRKVAIEWIKKNPKEFLIVMYGNIKELIFGTYEPLVYHELKRPLLSLTSALRFLLYIFFFAGLIRVFLAGKKHLHLAFFPLMIIFYLVAIHAPMHTEPRYFVYSYLFMALMIPACLTKNFKEGRLP